MSCLVCFIVVFVLLSVVVVVVYCVCFVVLILSCVFSLLFYVYIYMCTSFVRLCVCWFNRECVALLCLVVSACCVRAYVYVCVVRCVLLLALLSWLL